MNSPCFFMRLQASADLVFVSFRMLDILDSHMVAPNSGGGGV